MPDISILIKTQPGAGSGNGYSRNSYRPGSTNVAASTLWADMNGLLNNSLARVPKPNSRRLRGTESPPGSPVKANVYASVLLPLKIQLQRKLPNARVCCGSHLA